MFSRYTRLFAATLLLPVIMSAAPRLGLGGHVDPVSGGLELRIWLGSQQGSAFFIAPHAAGIYSSDSYGDDYMYSVGLRGGAIFASEKWIAPMVSIGGGHSASSDGYKSFGGRIAVGLSVAPFKTMGDEGSWLRGLDGLRFEFDSGFFYKMRFDSNRSGTFESRNQTFFMPDIGAGIIFSW